ncbi:MAG: organomercurial lyase MerB [Anaerolineae bacterium]|nr:organomercurial lyase MerB [Anaerolineae bacterium]
MKNHQIEQLTEVLDASFRENSNPQGYALFHQLILLLAEGRAVSPARIAEALRRSPEEVETILRQMPSIEIDEDGNVVGAGLTLRPTPHHFTIDDRTMFTWCALDALMFPGLLGQSVQVESPCVTTGIPVRMTVTLGGVGHVEPPEAVVSLVAPGASADIRRSFCDYVNFFSSSETACAWLSEHPGATTLPVKEAYQLGRRLAESIFEIKESDH